MITIEIIITMNHHNQHHHHHCNHHHHNHHADQHDHLQLWQVIGKNVPRPHHHDKYHHILTITIVVIIIMITCSSGKWSGRMCLVCGTNPGNEWLVCRYWGSWWSCWWLWWEGGLECSGDGICASWKGRPFFAKHFISHISYSWLSVERSKLVLHKIMLIYGIFKWILFVISFSFQTIFCFSFQTIFCKHSPERRPACDSLRQAGRECGGGRKPEGRTRRPLIRILIEIQA